MSLISDKTVLNAADIAALDMAMVIDASAGTSGTKKMYAMAQALGLSKLSFFEDTGGDDAYVISTGLTLTALSAGFAFALKVTLGNTGACTLAVDSVSAKAIKVVDASGIRDPFTGEIPAGGTALLSYNGTYFILLNPANLIPSQTNNGSKVLSTNGSTLAWINKPLTLFFSKANPADGDLLHLNGQSSVGENYTLRNNYTRAKISGAFSAGSVFSDDTLVNLSSGQVINIKAQLNTGGNDDQMVLAIYVGESSYVTTGGITNNGAQSIAWCTVELS